MDKILAVILAQAPDVLAQELRLERIDALGWLVVAVVAVLVSALVLSAYWGEWKATNRELAFVGPFALGAAILVFSLVGFCNAVNLAATFAAPKATAVNALLSHLSHKD